MKKLLGIFCAIMLFCSMQLSALASVSISNAIRKSKISRDAIAVSIKDINTGHAIYSHNANNPLNPASTQKLLTFAASLDTLGNDYVFSTELYKTKSNELHIKLGADPYLDSNDLKDLLKAAMAKKIVEPKALYIDDYIVDSETWGEGWQWDDDLNPLMTKFGAYNLDKNLINIVVKPTSLNSPADIYTQVFYPLGFVNYVTTGRENNLKLTHNTSISHNLLQVDGTVKTYTTIPIPVNNIKRYFRLRLEDAIKDVKLSYYGAITQKPISKDVYLIDKVEHPISDAAVDILQNSNNMIAETVFKIAGGKYSGQTGSIASSVEMLNNFCQKYNLNTSGIRIVDGSGVSKNNLVTANFMTDFLVKISKADNFEEFYNYMAKPGVGTLENRMLYFGENVRAKTGTLSNISAIAGYLKTRSGKIYAYDIMINDPKSLPSDKKIAEEMILRAVYLNY